MSYHDSAEDYPWPFMIDQVLKHFPDSKFIITRRSSPEIWWNSLCRHIDRGAPDEVKRIVFGCTDPRQYEKSMKALYENHINYCRTRLEQYSESFIEVCWEENDSWESICKMLGHDIPEKISLCE